MKPPLPLGLVVATSFLFAQIVPSKAQEAAPRLESNFDSDITRSPRFREGLPDATIYHPRSVRHLIDPPARLQVEEGEEISVPTPTPVPTVPPTPSIRPLVTPPPPLPRPQLFPVPLPNPAPRIPPPPVPETVRFVARAPTQSQIATPDIEVWRKDSLFPQRPSRRGRRFDTAFLLGTESALVRLQFHLLAAGKTVVVKAGPGVTVDLPGTQLRVGPTGECVVSVALNGSFLQSDITVYCVGVASRLPLARISQAKAETQEAEMRSR